MASVTFVPSRIAAGDFVDVPVPGSGDNGKAITYNHGTGLFVYTSFETSGAVSTHVGLANPHSQYLLASSYTAADVFAKVLTLDGSGSGLDADLLDGNSSAAFATSGHNHSGVLLADGSVTGAVGAPQTFTDGVIITRGVTGTNIIDNLFGTAYMPFIYQVDAANDYGASFVAMGNNSFGAYQEFIKSRSTDGDTNAAVQPGDSLAVFEAWGDDGADINVGASMYWVVDGPVSSGIVPVRMEFYTTDAAGDYSVPRMVIKNDGKIGINTDSPTLSDGVGLDINGKILRLRTQKTPASAGATGNAGEICADSNYIYYCVATNTWKRAALSTW